MGRDLQVVHWEASFKDSSDVTVDVTGDPDAAGFVQVMQGRGSDPERARELMSQDSAAWAAFRPDVVGSVAVGHEGGAYTMAMYFTSEAEAREGERKDTAGAEGPDGGDAAAQRRRAGVLRPQATLAVRPPLRGLARPGAGISCWAGAAAGERLISPRRSRSTCGNAGLHSGGPPLTRTEAFSARRAVQAGSRRRVAPAPVSASKGTLWPYRAYLIATAWGGSRPRPGG